MRSDQMENERYKKEDHCSIDLEEKTMFAILNDYAKQRGAEKNISVLDIGCGSGLITKKIKDMGYAVEGLDFSEKAVEKARLNSINAELCNLDEGITKVDDKFDVVWAGDIVEHVFDPIGLLREVNRVLKKGGIVILSVPNDVGLFNRIRTILGISFQEQMYKKSGFYKHHTFFTLRLIKYMLEKNNFSIKNIYKFIILDKKTYNAKFFPSFLYNELVICAKK